MAEKVNLKFRDSEQGELHEGVPVWMQSSLWHWIFDGFKSVNAYGDQYFNLELALEAERTLRHPIPGVNWSWEVSAPKLPIAFSAGDDVIYLVDFLVTNSSTKRSQELKVVLEQSGSKWTVGDLSGSQAIIERVKPETEAEFRALPVGTVSSELLLRARSHVYGINPNPPFAYHEAVKAVEAALGGLIEPNNSKATLGSILNVVRTQNWNFALDHQQHPELQSSLAYLCSLLWKGQTDRHASQVEDFHDVSQAEAELAVSIALLLVQSASRGHLVIKPNTSSN